jgi:hypothetical protein
MNTLNYVFENRQPELRQMVVDYGLKPAKNRLDLYKKVNAIVAKYKNQALKDIAKIHPDREFILWSVENEESAPKKEVVETKSSACGCSGADGEYSNCGGGCACGCGGKCGSSNNEKQAKQYSSVDGDTTPSALKNNMPIIVIGSLLAVGGLLLLGRQLR